MAMKINDLEFFLVELDCEISPRPIRRLLTRLTTDDGVLGWGDSPPKWRAEELPARREALLPVLAERNVFDIEELLRLEELSEPGLRGGLEMACWDALGRSLGRPLAHLFGGEYRSHIPVTIRLGQGPTDLIAQVAWASAEQGFHSQIITSTGNPQRDARTVAAVRESIGGRAELRLDGRAAYDASAVRELCQELEPSGLQMFVDPLDTPSMADVAALRRQTSVPLALSRLIHSAADVLAVARSGAARTIVVDPQAVGGLLRARHCVAVAEAAGLAVSLGSLPTTGLGVAAMLQLVAATPALASGNESAYHQLGDDILGENLEIVDGMAALPQGPGLGVDVDAAKVERYQVL
jgi:L-alanine-DL-glutamate epimerase-like enolase superfamily enzyme